MLASVGCEILTQLAIQLILIATFGVPPGRRG